MQNHHIGINQHDENNRYHHHPDHRYGGKFGVQKDRMDKTAMGHDFIAKVDKHGSQVDKYKCKVKYKHKIPESIKSIQLHNAAPGGRRQRVWRKVWGG